MLHVNLFPRTLDIKVGQVSQLDIRTPRDIIDPEATREAEKASLDLVTKEAKNDLSYYLINKSVGFAVINDLNKFFKKIEQERFKYHTPDGGIIEDITITKDQPTKYNSFFYQPISLTLLKKILLLPENDFLDFKIKSLEVIRHLVTTQKISKANMETILSGVPQILSDKQVLPQVSPMILNFVTIVIRPNLVLDKVKLNKLQSQVRMNMPPVIREQNELIIAKNQVVTANDIDILKELHFIADESNRLKVFFSLSFFVVLMIGLGWAYVYRFYPKLFQQERMVYLLLLLILLVVGLIKAFSLINLDSLPYLAPISLAAMLVAILVDSQLAMAITIMIGLLGGIIGDYNLALTIFYVGSGLVSVLSVNHFHRQWDLVRSGLILAVFNGIMVVLLNLLFSTKFSYEAVLLAAANGIFSAILAIGILPFVEHIFRITTPIRLLELANPSHPLLRRLQIEAPGTYHHSIMVGNLAEAAAQGIGADTLWVRVGSYYHDIGKIKRPYFFVENQFAQENPHEKLNPSLSTLVITYHVKEGADIAREHGLPDKLIEIIEQHHGTDLVRYFYQKATESLQDERETLIEEDFRYEGPKPQSKEAVLVMLADSVEAAVRALPKPTPAKIEALIQKIIGERLEDGQFDESNLTLKDLNQIKNGFMKVLAGLYHTRIEYPEKVLKEMENKKAHGNSYQ